jgi:hypothetical protein
LHSDLIAEWQPSGRTEHDLVFDLADLMWRKIRAQKYLQIILMQNSFDRDKADFGLADRAPSTRIKLEALFSLRPGFSRLG